jgi:hypothetical protein
LFGEYSDSDDGVVMITPKVKTKIFVWSLELGEDYLKWVFDNPQVNEEILLDKKELD